MPADRGGRAASGAQAEALAAAFLASKGLAIVARNVRSRFGEIDLVARDGDTLVFVEVRLRRSARFGGASGSITGAKLARIRAAAEGYLATLARIPAPKARSLPGRSGTRKGRQHGRVKRAAG